MPYFISESAPGCAGWATVKADGEIIGCHTTKQAAIDQMIALSLSEGLEPGGERNVNVPDYIKQAAARGLELRAEGHGGDGLTDQTIREARAMARGEISESKIIRANAWGARHAVDLEAGKNSNTNDPEWPGPGAVAHYLWGINPLNTGPARRWFERKANEMQEDRQLPDNYRPALSDDVPEGRACGNCLFYDESNVQGDRAFCTQWEEYVRGDHYCNAWQSNERVNVQDLEYRTFSADLTEIRASDNGDGMTFAGYAWRYNAPSLPLPFTERIAPGAFTRSLKSRADIRAYVNHNDELLLGSTRAKTLRIEDRADGGYVEIDLPQTGAGNDVRVLTKRGDISGMSFGFSTVRDDWSDDGTERTLLEAKIYEVSVVTGIPAYPQTSAQIRKLIPLAARTATDVDELGAAMSALQSGELSDEQAALLRTVVDKVAPQTNIEPTLPINILAAKLSLAEKALGL